MATPAYIGIDIETTGLDTSPISDDARTAAAEMLQNMGGENATTHRALFDIICSVEQIRRTLPRLAARVATTADTAV